MRTSLSGEEFKLMKDFINKECGILINEEKLYLIESRLSNILIDSEISNFEELYKIVSSKDNSYVIEKVIDAITTNETCWFREKTPWIILENKLLPMYIDEIRSGRKSVIKIWSCACSTGQEPYSISMCIDNYLKKEEITDITLSNFEILATDISNTVLKVAKMGKYDNISIMRGLHDKYRTMYFENQGKLWNIMERINNSVKFEQFNLQNSFDINEKYDVIFCRYVLIYFSDIFRLEVLNKFSRTLNTDGILFLGNAEVLLEYDKLYDIQKYENNVYYKLKR